ncbi:hypothetical protein B6N40_09835 [Cutibacterium avidum]|nr:hypothetical protein B6N40_09835 [Cutibacterium avidum]
MDLSSSTPSRWALPVILAAQLVMPLSIAGTAVALPQIAAQLGSTPGPLQWIVNGFNMAFALCTLVWGPVADRVGHDRVFRLGVTIVLVASLASALAPSLLFLDAARVLAGIGAAAVLTGATAVLSLAWEGPARTKRSRRSAPPTASDSHLVPASAEPSCKPSAGGVRSGCLPSCSLQRSRHRGLSPKRAWTPGVVTF